MGDLAESNCIPYAASAASVDDHTSDPIFRRELKTLTFFSRWLPLQDVNLVTAVEPRRIELLSKIHPSTRHYRNRPFIILVRSHRKAIIVMVGEACGLCIHKF